MQMTEAAADVTPCSHDSYILPHSLSPSVGVNTHHRQWVAHPPPPSFVPCQWEELEQRCLGAPVYHGQDRQDTLRGERSTLEAAAEQFGPPAHCSGVKAGVR